MTRFTIMNRLKDRLPSARQTIVGAALLLTGGAIGAGAMSFARPSEPMAPGAPVQIAALASAARPWVGEPVVTVQGRVAETYGGSIVIADNSGRALVDLGRRGVQEAALATNQLVTVQGRYDDGVIRARYLVGPDGRVAELGPGRPGGHGRHGMERFGPDAPEAPPAPPPSGNTVAPTT